MAEEVLAFFGAFNPPTKAHILLAKHAMNELHLKKVLFIPSKSDYITGVQHKDKALNDNVRLKLLETIAKENPWMEVCDYELKQTQQPKTFDTLVYLSNNGYNPHLLVGADVFNDFEFNWTNVTAIAKQFGIVVVDRIIEAKDGCEVEDLLEENPFYQNLVPYVDFIPVADNDLLLMSSSEARLLIDDIATMKEDLEAMLPEEIMKPMMKMILFS